MRHDSVDDWFRLDHARPSDESRHPEAALPRRALLTAERNVATVRPGEDLDAIVSGEQDNGAFGNPQAVELSE